MRPNYLRWAILLIVIGGAAWISISLLIEAYGAGPPHYGRTTNMDKWADPWPVVLLVDVCALAIAWLVAPLRRRGPKAGDRLSGV